MSDPRETLARIRAQADAATEGPWSVFHGKRCGTYVTRPDLAGVAREWSLTWSDADAEFIAASRTTVPALVDALEKVLKRHAPMHIYALAEDCEAPDDHEHGSTSDGGDDICWDEPTGEIHCCECRDKWGNPMKHPCPTFTTITTALEGETND